MDRVVPVLVNNKGERVEYPLIREKPYILFYWSASWCGPCRRFTPQLVDVYNKLGGGERLRGEDERLHERHEHALVWDCL